MIAASMLEHDHLIADYATKFFMVSVGVLVGLHA